MTDDSPIRQRMTRSKAGRQALRPGTPKPRENLVVASLLELAKLAETLAHQLPAKVDEGARLMAESIRGGGKILACGNGGSAADAQHFIAELVGRLERERNPLPGQSLTTDPSVITALANDYGYDRVFARQVEGLGGPRDVLLAISTSGRSANVVGALDAARMRGMKRVVLLGQTVPPALAECEVIITVPSSSAQRVQEAHTAILHALCERLEERLEEKPDSHSTTGSQEGAEA